MQRGGDCPVQAKWKMISRWKYRISRLPITEQDESCGFKLQRKKLAIFDNAKADVEAAGIVLKNDMEVVDVGNGCSVSGRYHAG